MSLAALSAGTRTVTALLWLLFQLHIVLYPLHPMIQGPVHVFLAVIVGVLFQPLGDRAWQRLLDWLLVLGAASCALYYVLDSARLIERMENVDPVFFHDMLFGTIAVLLVLEVTRRVIGWSLLGVILAFLAYGFLGPWFPGWLKFQGFDPRLYIEILAMTSHGLMGITTETSVTFVYYFIAFGAVYSATGGGQLFIDLALMAVGRQKGGAAKSAVISSALFGTISGSAVANVVSTGVFTIPLMKKTGYSPEYAGAHEAIASTGGQLMPPIMGIAAFVMAELLQLPYVRIAMAGLIPALAYYFALFMIVDLRARRTGIGSLGPAELSLGAPVLPRLHLLLAPAILIVYLAMGYSATRAALVGTGVAFLSAFFRWGERPRLRTVWSMIDDVGKQAAQVAIPITAIGIIIAVAIQSNLAIKFSTRLIEISGGTLLGAMILVIIGCIIMGMGLPTVAAYIIGAVLFVPALRKLGIAELSAHFFVMYYCVLSMITPPVALASYAGAGLAKANPMRTGWIAFRMSFVLFLIPFAFAFDESLLWTGPLLWILFAFASMLLATLAWAITLEGYFGGPVPFVERILFCQASLAILFAKTGSLYWGIGVATALGLCLWCAVIRPRWLPPAIPTR